MARFKLPRQARLHRKTLFATGRLPTDDEVWQMYDAILAMPGCIGYTRHTHSNWTTSHLRRRRSSPRAIIAAKLQENPFSNLVDVAGWALEANISEAQAFRLVGELLPEARLKALTRLERESLQLSAL